MMVEEDIILSPINRKIASSARKFKRFLTIKIKLATVRSQGTRNLVLSIGGRDPPDLDFSQIIGILSGYLLKMRVDSLILSSSVYWFLKGRLAILNIIIKLCLIYFYLLVYFILKHFYFKALTSDLYHGASVKNKLHLDVINRIHPNKKNRIDVSSPIGLFLPGLK